MAELKNKENGAKKPNFFVRMGKRIAKAWREYMSEMKKVVWMSGKDVKKNTILVVVAVLALSLAIGIVDYVFSTIIEGFAGMIG